MDDRILKSALALLVLALAVLCTPARAEPYLAVREGLACGTCHVNPTGGGMRTVFGDVYSQNQFAQWPVEMGTRGPWLGNVNDFLRVGGNFRYDGLYSYVPHDGSTDEFATDDLRVYGAADLIQNRLMLYVDERLSPGQSQTREVYGLYRSTDQRWYVKAGKMYLPFGFRIQDDESFVRSASGVSYATPDEGIEGGVDWGPWNGQLAVTNGNGGGSETDKGKQATASLSYIRKGWRAGSSLAYNDAKIGDRKMGALFAGIATGPVAWLLEADYIDDESFATGRRKLWAGLAEANWNFLKGNNLKLTFEYFEPDRDVDEDEQNRYSAVWEWSPIQFLQTRIGVRAYDGIPQNDFQNRTEGFAEAHVFF